MDGKKEIHYFGRKKPEPTPQMENIQPSIQGRPSEVSGTLDDHIESILDVVGVGAVVSFTRCRNDILYDMPIPEHTRILHIVKETRTQQTTRTVDKASYIVPATYIVKTGRSVMHIQNIQFVDFYYHQFSSEIRMNIHTGNGGKNSLLLRGIDVVKLAVWLKEHTRNIQP